MPAISRFYGIVVYMYVADDNRRHAPHIHVRYQGQKAVFTIKDRSLVQGKVPNKVVNLVKAWIEIHHEELMINWELSSNKQSMNKIEPLK